MTPAPREGFDPGEVAPWEQDGGGLDELGIIRMDAVQPEQINWLWPGRIPFGKLTVVEGDPKVGKSTLLLDVAARVTTGSPFPDGHRPASGTALIMTAEDGLADTVRPRLDAAGADVRRVIAWESVPVYSDEGMPNGVRPPSIPRDLDALERLIGLHGVVLVIVDVLNAYLGADVDGHKDQDVRRALMPLAKLAERTGAAIVVLRHLNKSSAGPAMYRGAGSIGISGAARSILLAGMDPEDEDGHRRVLVSQGSNIAADPPALTYELVSADEHGCARVRWLGTSTHTSATLLATSGDDDAVGEAREFLRDLLAAGHLPAKDVIRQASDAGHPERTIRRAKKSLGVRSVKAGMGGWEWALPEGGQHAEQDGHRSQVGSLGSLGSLWPEQGLRGVKDGHISEGCQDGQLGESGSLAPDTGWPCSRCGAATTAYYGDQLCHACFTDVDF